MMDNRDDSSTRIPKRVENRDWRSSPNYLIGNYIAWHTAKSFDHNGAVHMMRLGYSRTELEMSRPGLIVGVSLVEGVYEHPAPLPASHADQSAWYFGRYGIALSEPVCLLEPVPVARGALGWWKLPPETFTAVLKAYEVTQRARLEPTMPPYLMVMH
jgi:hypothetical protein